MRSKKSKWNRGWGDVQEGGIKEWVILAARRAIMLRTLGAPCRMGTPARRSSFPPRRALHPDHRDHQDGPGATTWAGRSRGPHYLLRECCNGGELISVKHFGKNATYLLSAIEVIAKQQEQIYGPRKVKLLKFHTSEGNAGWRLSWVPLWIPKKRLKI